MHNHDHNHDDRINLRINDKSGEGWLHSVDHFHWHLWRCTISNLHGTHTERARVSDLELGTGRTVQEGGMSSLTDQKGGSPQFAPGYSLPLISGEETVQRSHLREPVRYLFRKRRSPQCLSQRRKPVRYLFSRSVHHRSKEKTLDPNFSKISNR